MPAATIDRRCHWLRKNPKSRRPESLVFVDVESNATEIDDKRVEHTFRLGWAVHCSYDTETGLQEQEWYQISDPLSFWHWVSAIAVQCKNTYIIAHNIAYDARILCAFSILPGLGFAPDYAIMSHNAFFVAFVADKNKVLLLDNSNYWRVSLSELGQDFGVEKLSVDFETVGDVELSEYCKRDVEILVRVWSFWLEFLDEHKLGDFAVTAAGQAFNAYRHRFMNLDIGIHNRCDALNLERKSYRGGRVEVCKVGKFNTSNYYKLDVNGLYAYCMARFPHPQKLVKVVVARNPDHLKWLLDHYLCIADVIVETNQPNYCVTWNGQNVYPTGVFRCHLTTPELKIALYENHLRAIGEIAIYEPGDLFSNYIGELTPLRQQYKQAGDTARSWITKLLRNGLYGKFGQRGYAQEIIGDAPLGDVGVTNWIDTETGAKCQDWTFGGKTIRQTYTGEGDDSFPAIASHTSAYGRVHMLELAETAGWENCYYADTDSLIVNEQGYLNLAPFIDQVKLGHLKLEGVSDHLEIRAKKSYVFGGKRVLKGIKKTAIPLGNDRYSQWHFTTLNYAFKSKNLDNVLTYEVERHVTNALQAGRVLADGTVLPPEFSLSQDQVFEIVKPESRYNTTWWVNLPWLASLPPKDAPVTLPVDPLTAAWFS